MRRKTLKLLLALVVLAAAGAQFVQPQRTNPPSDPASSFEAVAGPSQEAAAVLRRACYDCHSNQTRWPWYSRVAPVSWLVAGDVREGRLHMNLSEWNRLGAEMSRLRRVKMCEEVRSADMPPLEFRIIHGEARLTAADVAALCAVPVAGL